MGMANRTVLLYRAGSYCVRIIPSRQPEKLPTARAPTPFAESQMALPVCTFIRTPRHLSKCFAHVNTLHMRAMRRVSSVLLLPAHPPVDPESPPLGACRVPRS
jgi:hypothetical protein